MLRVDRCRDMDKLITFKPDPDYSPDAGTGLLSPISYALQRGILIRRANSTYWPRGFKMGLLTACRRNTFVGGTCALSHALLVFIKRLTLR